MVRPPPAMEGRRPDGRPLKPWGYCPRKMRGRGGAQRSVGPEPVCIHGPDTWEQRAHAIRKPAVLDKSSCPRPACLRPAIFTRNPEASGTQSLASTGSPPSCPPTMRGMARRSFDAGAGGAQLDEDRVVAPLNIRCILVPGFGDPWVGASARHFEGACPRVSVSRIRRRELGHLPRGVDENDVLRARPSPASRRGQSGPHRAVFPFVEDGAVELRVLSSLQIADLALRPRSRPLGAFGGDR